MTESAGKKHQKKEMKGKKAKKKKTGAGDDGDGEEKPEKKTQLGTPSKVLLPLLTSPP